MKQQLSYQMDDGLNVTEISVSYDNFVFQDLEENIVYKKSTIDRHYNIVMSTLGDTYKGINKYAYGNILQAFKTIVDVKKNRWRKSKTSEAVGYLHQEMRLSPATIQRVLLLFEVKMSTGQILKHSNKVFDFVPIPTWAIQFFGGVY